MKPAPATPPARRLAVFDVDGTLVDSQHNIVAAMVAAFSDSGLAPPPAEAVRRIIGLSLAEAVARLLPDAPAAVQRDVVMSYKQGFASQRRHASPFEPLFPGALATLDRLAADGWLLAVATGKSRRGLLSMIDRHGLEGRFVSLQTADDNPGKPHPAMLRRVLLDADLPPAQAVMIGDTSYDMLMATAAGTGAIGVAWGYHAPAELLAAGARQVVTAYDDLPPALERLIALP